ncbi:MAG TPA: MBL fold metallo-hydrolase [Spirochaetales bacterium]|nr:MBL fold metallo-hydrolase [Spirochaetales bacterium]HRY55904.1 MBL fold metallo-hydrolase [Spirochaetia bacterium]
MKLYHHYSLYGFSNVYLLGNDATKEALVVDPAEMNATLLGYIERNGYGLKGVLVTHNHTHHVRGLKTLLKIYDPLIYAANAQVLGFPSRPVRDGEPFSCCGFEVLPHFLPGHSPDSVAYRVGHLVFTGDALHAGILGKTLSTHNAATLKRRLDERVFSLPDECVLLPGHGPPSTVGTERRFNVGLEPGYAERVSDRYDFFV